MAMGGPSSALSQKLGKGNLLYGGEEYYYNGPWKHPDAYNKLNGLLTYSQGDDANGASITAHGLPRKMELERSNPRYRHTPGWFLRRTEPD